MSNDMDLSALQGFIDETNESLQGIESAFIELEKDPGNAEIINKIFRPVHSMKGNSGFFGLTHINKFAHRMEDLLDLIRKGEIIANPEIIDILLTGIDYLQKMLDQVETDPSITELSQEEEDFLTDKVVACKPASITGSTKSVIEFEELLNEAMDAGIVLQDHSFIRKALDQIAKYTTELKELIKHKAPEQEEPFPADLTFHHNGAEVTNSLGPVVFAANRLAKRKPLLKEEMISFNTALREIEDILGNQIAAEMVIDELKSMANFLDDELMSQSAEFCESTSKLIAKVTDFFEIKKPTEGEKKIGEILVDQQAITPEQLSGALAKQEKLGQILKKDGLISDEALKKAVETQSKQIVSKHVQQKAKLEKSKSIRIDQNKLDNFADSVGELFISVDSLNFLTKKLEQAEVDSDTMARFGNTISALDDMLHRLQENVMSVRKIPVNTLFQRFPRVIRQLAASLEKEIDFRLTGENTVIDKDLLETIENPLVHILRNSVDHGIELPALREDKNKPRQGVLELAASVDENNAYLIIKDDGAGISPQKMKEIAVAKDFKSQAEVDRMSDDELVNLIFKPGFSTAEKVSDVSGRGVGMDAVMAGLEQCNGNIHVDSKINQGTKVTMTIPLTRTLVTKDALIIETSKQIFAIPSDDITITLYPDDSLANLLDNETGILYNHKVLPIIDANNFFFHSEKKPPQTGSEQVIIVCEKHGVALLVDRMYNHQQIVVKVFKDGYKPFKNIPGINGFTILGNEEIVLIFDIAAMAREVLQG